MSVKVDLANLADAMAEYGPAYLVTVTEDQRPHAVAVQPVLREEVLVVGSLGSRTTANLAARPKVTLLFPPRDTGGYTLIVDGRAWTDDAGTRVAPEHAVLHRPVDHAEPPAGGSCGNDCVPVSLT